MGFHNRPIKDRDMNDPHVLRAQKVLREWVQDITAVGMMSTKRSYTRELALQYLEMNLVAECLTDLLAEEFAQERR